MAIYSTASEYLKLDRPVPSSCFAFCAWRAKFLAALCAAHNLRSISFMPSDRLSYARYIMANIVSPPQGYSSLAYSVDPSTGTHLKVASLCHVRPALHPLMRFLRGDLDFGVPVELGN
jgi:hypothetical protein